MKGQGLFAAAIALANVELIQAHTFIWVSSVSKHAMGGREADKQSRAYTSMASTRGRSAVCAFQLTTVPLQGDTQTRR